MKPPGFFALIRAVFQLIVYFCRKGHGSFRVEVERMDATGVIVVVEHGDHDRYEVRIAHIQSFLDDYPQFA